MSNTPFDGDALDRIESVFGNVEDVPDEFKGLLDQVGRDVVGWKPAPGDTVIGTLVDISEAESEYGSYPLLTVEVPGARLVGVHCFHTVLRREIERKLARNLLHVGDQIAVQYRGEGVATSGRNAPNMYRVAVKPADNG